MDEKAGRCPDPGHSFDFFLLPCPSPPSVAPESWLVTSLGNQEASSSGLVDITHGRHQMMTSIVFQHRELTRSEASQIMWGSTLQVLDKKAKNFICREYCCELNIRGKCTLNL